MGQDDRIRLITRGDDAGCCCSAGRAILTAFERGIVRNVSVMAPAPQLKQAGELLGPLAGLCAGLHVTVTCEWDTPRWGPVLDAGQVPALVDDRGHFLADPAELNRRNPPLEQMLAEVRAQLQAARASGFDIRYFDLHMGVGWISGLDEALADWARQEGLINGASGPWGRLERTGEDLPPNQRLAKQLESAQPGTYLVVGHPLFASDPDARAIGRSSSPPPAVAENREFQRRMFTDPEILDVVARRGIQPIRYDEI
jgi:hypothetical protein